jgi:hypothetical protein
MKQKVVNSFMFGGILFLFTTYGYAFNFIGDIYNALYSDPDEIWEKSCIKKTEYIESIDALFLKPEGLKEEIVVYFNNCVVVPDSISVTYDYAFAILGNLRDDDEVAEYNILDYYPDLKNVLLPADSQHNFFIDTNNRSYLEIVEEYNLKDTNFLIPRARVNIFVNGNCYPFHFNSRFRIPNPIVFRISTSRLKNDSLLNNFNYLRDGFVSYFSEIWGYEYCVYDEKIKLSGRRNIFGDITLYTW